MKKILIVMVVLSVLAITACKKKTTVNGGSWTFKSKTYSVTSAISDQGSQTTINPDTDSSFTRNVDGTLSAVCSESNAYGNILFTFYQLPTVSGQYTLTHHALPDDESNQIAINMALTTGATYTGPTYTPDSASASTVTVNVTVTNKLITIDLPAVDMINATDPTDHAPLTAKIIQTER